MSFQVLLRSFQVFKYTDQNFAGWLVTSKRNPTERLAPSPRPRSRIASGRWETKYSFPDFSLKISAGEIHDTSMATSHATMYSSLYFFRCFYSSIYFSFTYINSALALRWFSVLYYVVTYPILLKILHSTRVLSSFTFLTPVFALSYFL